MPSWWGKSSSKEAKKKTNDETFLDSLRRKLRSSSDVKLGSGSGGSRIVCNDIVSERGSQSRAESRSSSPSKESKQVARCQSFAETPLAQPLPIPGLHSSNIGRTDSGISISLKPGIEKNSKSSLFLPLPRPSCIGSRAEPAELDGDLVTAPVSSASSVESDDLTDFRLRSPQASDVDIGPRTAAGSPSSALLKDQSFQSSRVTRTDSREPQRPVNNLLSNQNSSLSPRRKPLRNHVPALQVPSHGAFCSAPDSSMSSPSRSPMRASNTEQIINAAFRATKPYPDVTLLGSGHCSSPGSGHNSGHNSMGGDILGQLFGQPSRGSPEYSPIPSPRMASPGPSSRVQSGAVTPIHPRAGGSGVDMLSSWGDDGKQQSHRLPLPPIAIPSSPFSHGNSAATSPSVPRSPTRGENPPSPGFRWKKGKLLGRGTFGHVYLGFNRDTGEMCAMKEVTLFSDDPKSKESAKQLGQEIALLSRLQHPNIVQYYGSETVGDRLYIYLEYVSGGSIYKLLQEYGQLGEPAIRSYTQQILSGLAYLHEKNTVHRDIKGANILVDPNGRVKLADFGMAKHITGQSCPLSFKGSPYWMAPEVIKCSNGCSLAVDIWSLGCTVLEMATTKPPWSEFEGVAALFKIGNSKELPTIPDHLSQEGKEFVTLCLQRNPHHRPTATQLLEHPFVKNAAPLERAEWPVPASEPVDTPSSITNGMRALGVGLERNLSGMELERLAVHSSKVSPTRPRPSEFHILWDISYPVSPTGSPLLHRRSPQQLSGMMSPSPISSPRTTSGSSTPLTGGSGAIPFHQSQPSIYMQEGFGAPRTTSGSSTPLTGGSGAIPFHQSQPSIYMQEGFGAIPRSPNSVFLNGMCYHDPNMNALRGMQPGPRTLTAFMGSENDVHLKPVLRSGQGDLCNGQSELADRVSQQFLQEHVKLNPSVELSPRSTLRSRTNGL